MFGGGNNMEKQLFNLKFAAKNLERSSNKCEKEEKAEKLKLKKVTNIMERWNDYDSSFTCVDLDNHLSGELSYPQNLLPSICQYVKDSEYHLLNVLSI